MARKKNDCDKIDELQDLSSKIDVEKLTTTGMIFDLTKTPSLFDADLDVDDYEEEEEVKNYDVFETSSKEPFEQLWKMMPRIQSTDLIRKTVFNEGLGIFPNENSTITILYSGYFDNITVPFMSCDKLHPSTFNLKESGLMPGLELAIFTMSVGEKARFLIHYSLMYGDLGCEPHIPKKANCLVNIALLDVKEASNEDLDDISFVKFNKFRSVCEKAKQIVKDGIDLIENKSFKKASKKYSQALNMLQNCKLANYEEEMEQRQFVSDLYLKLAWCFIELRLPKQTCCMCQDFFKYTTNRKNSEVYLLYGKALIKLSAYEEAADKFRRGLKIDAKNEELKLQLKLLNDRMAHKNVLEEEICQIEKIQLKDDIDNPKTIDDATVSQEFLNLIENLCNKIAEDQTIRLYDYTLPPGLSTAELNSINLMAITFNLSVKINKDVVTFSKTTP